MRKLRLAEPRILEEKGRPWVDYLFFVANLVSIAGAILVVVGTDPSATGGYGFWGAILVAVGSIASFGSATVAERRTREEIARSRAIAMTAQQATAKAHVEIARLKTLTEWRRLHIHQIDGIAWWLRQLAHEKREEVWMCIVHSNPEVDIFQQDIRQALASAGYSVRVHAAWNGGLGLHVYNVQTPTGAAISKAFEKAGIAAQVHTGDVPGDHPGIGFPQIFVGMRPPPSDMGIEY